MLAPMTLPKAEIHVHLIGTVAPALVRALAARNRITLPEDLFTAEDRFVWSDFGGFMRAFDASSSVLRSGEDYRDITYDYLRRAAAEGAIYVEFHSSPDGTFDNGVSYREHCQGVAAGIDDARRDFAIEACVIVTAQRHRGPEAAEKVARLLHDEPHPAMRGFGLAGDEARWPPQLFAHAFAIAAETGCGCTAHAGELAGPESVRAALDHLPIARIGHGVRSIEDPGLVRELAARGVTLEVCPDSNIALGLYRDRQAHPFPVLDRAGVKVTLSSDDPPYFGASIGREYEQAKAVWGYSDADLRRFTRNAIEVGFMDHATKARLLAGVR
jgi:adenosine deaminase